MENTNKQDDGSLNFLQIPPESTNKYFNCQETTQQQLINLTFWVVDYIGDVKTKFGESRFIVKIKMDKNDSENSAKKFFTNSKEIKYIVEQIAQRNAFPRKVTMKASGNRYWFE
jgi:hypothetical protein